MCTRGNSRKRELSRNTRTGQDSDLELPNKKANTSTSELREFSLKVALQILGQKFYKNTKKKKNHPYILKAF